MLCRTFPRLTKSVSLTKSGPLTKSVSYDIPRVCALSTTASDFFKLYVAPGKPCIVINADQDWQAKGWTVAEFKKNYSASFFEVGKENNADPVIKSMGEYLDYCELIESGSPSTTTPLYLFDSTFDSDAPQLAMDYAPPPIFPVCVFSTLPPNLQHLRPEHKWLLVGPERSGSALHVDHLQTCAWNYLAVGTKTWAIEEEGSASVLPSRREGETLWDWFGSVLPSKKFVQRSGEVVFVPAGAGHAVLNNGTTIAVTHNFLSGGGGSSIDVEGVIRGLEEEVEVSGEERRELGDILST